MALHTGLYTVVGKQSCNGHKTGETFELTAEKSTIGTLVIAGVLKPALPETQEGEQ